MTERCEAHGMGPGLCTVRGCHNYDGGADRHGLPRVRRKNRSRTVLAGRAAKAKGASGRALRRLDLLGPSELPATRGECLTAPRPCPFVSCKHHLYLDVGQVTGSLKLNFPDLEGPEDMKVSCALDVADAGGVRLEDVAQVMNVTRERVRQIEVRALYKLEVSGVLKEDDA